MFKTRYGLLNMCVKPTHIALTQTTLSTQTIFRIVVVQGHIANIDVIFSQLPVWDIRLSRIFAGTKPAWSPLSPLALAIGFNNAPYYSFRV